MIDYVHLSHRISIPHDDFRWDLWRAGTDKKTDRQNYWHHQRGVYIRYYPDIDKIIIDGKILTLLFDTQVLNVDDEYGANMDAFISDINNYLNSLFYANLLDIRSFYVMRIDYCINVKTPYVREYLDFMSAAFRAVSKGKRLNYTEEKGLSGSVYIKTKSDYTNNTRRNYVMNFYDKADWLENKLDDGWHFSVNDVEDAQDVLRLEAQCGGGMLRNLIREHGINRTIGDMLSFRLAYEAIERVYNLALKGDIGQDFYTCAAAKPLVPKGAPTEALKKLAQNNRTKISAYCANKIKQAGVYPYHFIPASSKFNWLENPLVLIKRKLAGIGVDIE